MTTQENLLARHSILHELGRGATGAVYAARDRTSGAVVALKRLDPSLLASDPGLAARFLQHARSAQRLHHRNIARIHDAGEAAGTAYVVMELLEGENLRALLDAGPLPVTRAIRIAHEVASGLAHAHLEGVIHGGLKPSNVIVLRTGEVKITDFGTAQDAPAPEQKRGGPVDHRCDIFALGALFYEMLTGQPPREGAAPPSEVNPLVPRALDAVVLSMLASQPAARMPGVPVLLRELERLEEGMGLRADASATREEPAPGVPPPPKPEPVLRTPEPPRARIAESDTLAQHMAIMERDAARRERPARSRQPAIFAALALVVAVIGIGLADFMGFTRITGDFITSRIERIAATGVREPPAPSPVAKATKEEPAPAPAPVPEPTPVAPEPLTAKPLAAAPAPGPKPAPEPAPAPAPAPEEPKSAPVAPAPPPPTVAPTVKAAPVQKQLAGTARLILSVSPRGELYVDGEHLGATPPITTLKLDPGLRRIEVRNGSRKPFLTYMTVEPGDVRRIRHDFNAKPLRPPG